jgi:hypothetical protein
MDSQDKKSKLWSDHDRTVYVPDDLYHSFQNIFEQMEEAQKMLHRVRDEMKPVEN